jgi:hypothetical protein
LHADDWLLGLGGGLLAVLLLAAASIRRGRVPSP